MKNGNEKIFSWESNGNLKTTRELVLSFQLDAIGA